MGLGLRNLTTKQKSMAVVALLMVCAVVLVYGRPILRKMPTPGSLDRKDAYLASLQTRLQKLERQKVRRDANLATLQANCKGFLWEGRDRVLSTVVQNELQNIARRERATLRSVGSPRTREINEAIRAVEVSVRVQGDMKEMAAFLASVDAAKPRYFWTTCTIRPTNLRDPDTLDLSGRIEALFVVGAAEQLLFGDTNP